VSASGFPSDAASCGSCGVALPGAARFCPSCGRDLGAERGAAVRAPSARRELSSATVSVPYAEARWFGLSPASLLLAVSFAGLGVAIVLFALGRWPWGLIVAGVSGLLAVFFVETARRKPDRAIAERARAAIVEARPRLGALLRSAAIRSRARSQITRIKLELRRLQARRRGLLTVFGDAVYRGADTDAATTRTYLEGVDARIDNLEEKLHRIAVYTRERIDAARLAVQDTQTVTRPEPYPPPDEGDLPGPVTVHEPAPPPDEGTPPAPDPVPTPGPAGDPEPPDD
jgi:hypothetical protein